VTRVSNPHTPRVQRSRPASSTLTTGVSNIHDPRVSRSAPASLALGPRELRFRDNGFTNAKLNPQPPRVSSSYPQKTRPLATSPQSAGCPKGAPWDVERGSTDGLAVGVARSASATGVARCLERPVRDIADGMNGPFETLDTLIGPFATRPMARTDRSLHRTPWHRTLRVGAGRCAPGAREAGLTRPHPPRLRVPWVPFGTLNAPRVALRTPTARRRLPGSGQGRPTFVHGRRA
jgi:hypothetical protein